MSIDLWTEASVDVEAENAELRQTRAKVACASLWPFLALATTVGEFEHRLALVSDRIVDRVDADLIEPVTASLRADFRILASDGDNDADDQGGGSDGGAGDADDSGGKPQWLQDKISGTGAKHDDYEPDKPRKGTHDAATEDDEDDPNYWKSLTDKHSRRVTAADDVRGESLMQSGNGVADANVPQGPQPGQIGRNTQTGQGAGDPFSGGSNPFSQSGPLTQSNPNAGTGLAPGTDMQKMKQMGVTGGLQFFHASLGRWVALDDDANSGAGNPDYFVGGPEAGPQTGRTEQYPTFPDGSPGDPVDPLGGMFPMQPSPWVTPPDKAWRETPMNFTPPGGGYHPDAQRSGSRLPFAVAAEVGDTAKCRNCTQPMKRTGSGWIHTGRHGAEADDQCPGVPDAVTKNSASQNPNYFAGGGEGAAGDQQSGFPADVSQPEEDWMVDDYGTLQQPEQDTGARVGRRHASETHLAPDSDPNLGTEYDSPQEAERYRRMRNGEKPGDRDSSTIGRKQAFYDPTDPSVGMVRTAADPYGGDNPYDTSSAGGGGAPQAPPVMTPGGPGAEAMPPMNPGPGGVAQTTPPRQMPGGAATPPGGAANANAPQPTDRQATALHHRAGDTRERPTAQNPYGTDDPFDAKTWENAATQAPRIPMEHMNFNGPQNPGARTPIRTTTAPGTGGQRPEEDEDD